MGTVLVTGASGYVGGRLVPLLERRGERVRCLARRPELLAGRFAAATELVAGDVLDPASLRRALAGVTSAYYLVHALGSRGRFEEEEERAAHTFAAAARATSVQRIVYLGGLVTDGTALPASAHMRSRLRVGEILRASGIPTVEFRASIVIGAGSLSFEMIRALVQRLPVMVTPRWVSVEAQPKRGTRRLFLPVPLLTPHLSSLWLGLVPPLFARVGRKLIESITLPSVVRDPGAAHAFSIRPCDYRSAIRRALADEDARFVATRWADARSALAGVPRRWGGARFGTRLFDSRTVTTAAAPKEAFAPVQGIGGGSGWYYGNALWRLRGVLDRLFGGPGMKRGRRDPLELRPGDVVDCWRVLVCEPPRRLLLEAEMRPGARLAAVRSHHVRRRCAHPADRAVRPRGRDRPGVLVPAVPGPRADLPRHAARRGNPRCPKLTRMSLPNNPGTDRPRHPVRPQYLPASVVLEPSG